MNEIAVPTEVKFSKIKEVGSLSPNNYKKLTIKNSNQSKIKRYLNDTVPFIRGIEPGSSFYVKTSKQIFLRNSCINNTNFSQDKEKYIYLNPNYYNDFMIKNEDVLFCTDANIGDCCIYINSNENVIFSSGIVNLKFKDDKQKYYVMAFMRDNYFREQLNALTPKGSTIRHSGDLFLECFIPDCPAEWVYSLVENLIKNIAFTEYYAEKKLKETETLISKEVIKQQYDYINPTFKRITNKKRLDSGIYSNTVFQWMKNIQNYKYGYTNIEDFGFKLKRGPNLAKRDLGRSIQTEYYHKGYNLLIYPSDISNSGYINKVTYLGARNPIWFLEMKDILFSSEGTIGKTFIVCDDSMHFTTNFHGTIISPLSKKIPLNKSIFLGLYLNYLRKEDILSKMSVGANGGSFAVGYWNNIIIPIVPDEFIDSLAIIYDNKTNLTPYLYNENAIKDAGIYQLNNFIINCKALLQKICIDIKENKLEDESFYKNF